MGFIKLQIGRFVDVRAALRGYVSSPRMVALHTTGAIETDYAPSPLARRNGSILCKMTNL